ncbi:MAG: thioredoxin family protein [Deltaproteobacteria bacterium]|jgi:small redox-active disulfide protein 2|nr:thioredoxin family protein [Deltaproteobacteria bacterium]MBW1747997.1 thioredoxin family protein [Deltaproteobacteria bacterium]MBW1827247.1 thioredoxin family protein [Deltaproteobacteria bacterium]MBW1969190.1 thioredoxin family protein [Deltaproteobacteria bacterium]MBW2197805.1 thioredoxin family protein [Deltaproteobacteria bacterium]
MTISEVTQIKIDKHKVGFVGLEEVFKDIAELYAEQPDDVVAEELLIRLSKKNYISDKVQKEYGRAFVREFRKFLGQPVGDESPEGLEIKVLGAGCVLCNSLENEVMEVLSEIGLSADLEHVRDVEQIAKYSVKGTPALIINGKVMCSGRIPSKNMIRKWLEKTGVYEDSGGAMTKPVLIKNILFSEPHNLDELVAYESGRVVSRTFSQNSSLSITLFSFDEGEGLSRHTAPGDAMVQILDGEAVVNIDGKEMTVGKGQVVVMPADIPHSVTAVKRFKMLLTLVKRPQNSSSK